MFCNVHPKFNRQHGRLFAGDYFDFMHMASVVFEWTYLALSVVRALSLELSCGHPKPQTYPQALNREPQTLTGILQTVGFDHRA